VQRIAPRQPIIAASAGVLFGLVFPVCECGVVPVTRRLYQKGLPLASGVAFLLAAPILNPVVIASTLAAYGWSSMFWGRIGAAILITVAVGGLFHWAEPESVLRDAHDHHYTPVMPIVMEDVAAVGGTPMRRRRFWRALTVAGDEFLDMAQYLIKGAPLFKFTSRPGNGRCVERLHCRE